MPICQLAVMVPDVVIGPPERPEPVEIEVMPADVLAEALVTRPVASTVIEASAYEPGATPDSGSLAADSVPSVMLLAFVASVVADGASAFPPSTVCTVGDG